MSDDYVRTSFRRHFPAGLLDCEPAEITDRVKALADVLGVDNPITQVLEREEAQSLLELSPDEIRRRADALAVQPDWQKIPSLLDLNPDSANFEINVAAVVDESGTGVKPFNR